MAITKAVELDEHGQEITPSAPRGEEMRSPKSVAVLVLGESGSGKTTSLRNLNPETTGLVQPIRKPLPFRSKGWRPVVTTDVQTVLQVIRNAKKFGKTTIVIDDFQYLLCSEFMLRLKEKGFDKFNDIGGNAWQIMRAAGEAEDGVNVYLLSHVAETDGIKKAKTIGRMVDDKIVVEGMFSIVLRADVIDGQHGFVTRNGGYDTVKTPIGMFADPFVDNDLAMVDSTIRAYYAAE